MQTHTDVSALLYSWNTAVCGAPVMADQEETFGPQNSPGGSEPRDLPSESKPESKQNGTASKSPSSQTTYIQQVSGVRVGWSAGL